MTYINSFKSSNNPIWQLRKVEISSPRWHRSQKAELRQKLKVWLQHCALFCRYIKHHVCIQDLALIQLNIANQPYTCWNFFLPSFSIDELIKFWLSMIFFSSVRKFCLFKIVSGNFRFSGSSYSSSKCFGIQSFCTVLRI